MGVSSSSSVSQVLLLSKHGSSHENEVFTFPSGSGRWLFSAKKELCLRWAVHSFQDNESWFYLRSPLYHQPHVEGVEWWMYSRYVLPHLLFWLTPLLSHLHSYYLPPVSPCIARHCRWWLVQGTNFSSHDKARKRGSHKAWVVPYSEQDQEVSQELLHAITNLCIITISTAAAVTAQMGL